MNRFRCSRVASFFDSAVFDGYLVVVRHLCDFIFFAGTDGYRVRSEVSGDRGRASRVAGLRERDFCDGRRGRRFSDRTLERPG